MAKRFSGVDLGNIQKVVSGFIEPESLSDIKEFVDLMTNTYEHEELKITIFHMLFLDFEDSETTDATEEEVEILQDKLPDFYDYGCIVTECEIEIEGLYGVKEDEIVDRFM